jgi:hypothetical protein
MKPRGIALITTMMVMALLLTLVGAFISVEKSSSRLTGNALERRAAQDACLTALNLAWGYLEADPYWGSTGHFAASTPTAIPASNPTVLLERQLVGSDKILKGVVQAEGQFTAPNAVTFEMKVYNNLRVDSGSGQPSVREPAMFGSIPVPARSVRLICKAVSGSSTRRMDTILRQVPISYDSLAAKRTATIESNLLRLESRDPYVNRVQAADMNLPSATQVQFLRHGTANSNRLSLGGIPTTTEEQLNSANDASGGLYNIGQGAPTIPTFNSENFRLPEAADGKVTTISPGSYEFGGLPRVRYLEQTIAYEVPPPPPPPGEPAGSGSIDSCIRYQKETSTYDQLIDADGRVFISSQAREGSVVLDPPTVPTNPLGSEGAAESWGYDMGTNDTVDNGADVHEIYPGLYANVLTAQIAVKPGYRLDCNGAFRVTADGSRLPEVLFGYSFTGGGVATQESLDDGLEAALNDPDKYMGAIVASGDIDIPGGVIGYGSMMAGGDMTLKASSGLRAAPQLGVTVKARSLTINPATEPEPQLPGEPVSIDYPIFQEAISGYAAGDWSQFDNWLTQNGAQRASITQAMKVTPLSQSASTLWGQLQTELNISMTFPSPSWVGPVTIEQYIRLKEFAQTVASKYNNGAGDVSWLDMSKHRVDAEMRLSNTVSTMAQWAKSYKKTLQAYLASPTPEAPEMFYQGLLYADQDLIINANGKSFRLEGSAMAGGNASIVGARAVDLVYDRALVDNQIKTNHTTQSGNTSFLRLEKVFFTIN